MTRSISTQRLGIHMYLTRQKELKGSAVKLKWKRRKKRVMSTRQRGRRKILSNSFWALYWVQWCYLLSSTLLLCQMLARIEVKGWHRFEYHGTVVLIIFHRFFLLIIHLVVCSMSYICCFFVWHNDMYTSMVVNPSFSKIFPTHEFHFTCSFFSLRKSFTCFISSSGLYGCKGFIGPFSERSFPFSQGT